MTQHQPHIDPTQSSSPTSPTPPTPSAGASTGPTEQGTVGFVGGGAMSERIIDRVVATGARAPEHIWVADVLDGRVAQLASTYGIRSHADGARVPSEVDLLVLAVRPQDLVAAAASYRDFRGVVLSIMAGVTLSTLTAQFPDAASVVRAMPNVLGATGRGFSALCVAGAQSAQERARAESLLGALGRTIVIDEARLDAFTGFSTAGPAAIMHVIAALIDAGVHAGFPRAQAREIVLENMLGSAGALAHGGEHPLVFVDTMTSPGGVTIEMVRALHDSAIAGALMRAIGEAVRRAEALS